MISMIEGYRYLLLISCPISLAADSLLRNITYFVCVFCCKVRGQIRLLDGGSICFGLMDYPVSEFELVAEELLMSDSVIKVPHFLNTVSKFYILIYIHFLSLVDPGHSI